MNKTELINAASRAAHKVVFTAKKHSPVILIVGGLVTLVAGGVGACVATKKLDGVITDTKKEIDHINASLEAAKQAPEGDELVAYTEKQAKKDLAKARLHGAGQIAKLYGAPVTAAVLGTASVLTGAKILNGRYLSMAAAYTSVNETFKRYSNGVIERFGKEMDEELRYGIKAKNIIETVVNEDGTETTTTTVVEEANLLQCDTDKFFDELNPNYTKSAEDNLRFLFIQQSVANEKLRRKGHLFLNDVYALIGINPTKAGQSIGWIYDERNPVGDNCVDFGLGDPNRPSARMFVNGHEKAVLLHFNHDGNILLLDRPLFEIA
jgi:hypothetical protein